MWKTIDARVHGHQIAPTHQPDDVVITGAELKKLPARDHAVLHPRQQVLELLGVEDSRFAPLVWPLEVGRGHGLDAPAYVARPPPGT